MNHSLCFLAATFLTGQAGDARPMPQAGGGTIIQSAPQVYMDGQGQAGNWQPQRRGLFSRIGGWFSGVFGRNRNSDPAYDSNGQIINGQMINGRIIQQPMNTNEPPVGIPGKSSMMMPQGGDMNAATSVAIAQVSHDPNAPAMDLPVADKFKNRIGHEADYTWLSGQLYRLEGSTGALWMVRYATAGEQDKHGGTVLLAPAVNMQNFRDGDLVSIKGEILNGGQKSEQMACPVYRASEISLIERGD